MTPKQTLGTALKVAKNNPYTGTSKQICNLSISIAETFRSLDSSIYGLYKNDINISPKIFSKLKVIGEKLLDIPEDKRRDLVDRLPASYSTIHILCALDPEELVTAVKSKVITSSVSVREAKAYVRQVRFPTKAALDGEKGKWGYKQENLFNIVRPDDVHMSEEVMNILKNELRKVCTEYGAQLQVANPSGTATLRKQERNEKGLFWKAILRKQLNQKWFDKASDPIKKQFNIRTVQELHEAPIRSFTGFIIKASGGKETFWQKHGESYIAKLQMLAETTEDAAQRYNYRRRLETVMSERKELAIWNNLILKDSGFF